MTELTSAGIEMTKGEESDSCDWSDQVQELEMTLSHAFMAEVDEKRSEESNYRDAKRKIDEITLKLNQVKTELSKTKVRVEKYDYSSNMVANIIVVQYRGKRVNGIGYNLGHEFSVELVSLMIDPNLKNMNYSDDSKICAEKLSTSGQADEKEKISARNSTDSPTVVLRNHKFSISKVNYVGSFKLINIKPNDMVQNFKAKFAKSADDVKRNEKLSKENENASCSTITEEVQRQPVVITEQIISLQFGNRASDPTGLDD
ncbi:hypothetical protein R6Q57_008383 [Mikania cordata]